MNLTVQSSGAEGVQNISVVSSELIDWISETVMSNDAPPELHLPLFLLVESYFYQKVSH
jgi:hypothetical protein